MWHIHTVSGEEGWHICQKHSQQSAKLLVFVKEGDKTWRMKLWNSSECSIRAKTHNEHVQDDHDMTTSGFILHNSATLTPKKYLKTT